MEGKFYLADCNVSKSGYLLTLRSSQGISVFDSDLELAKQALCEKIMDLNGDGEPQIELVYEETPHWFVLEPDYSVSVTPENKYYEGGLCKSCSIQHTSIDIFPWPAIVGFSQIVNASP